MPLQVTAEPVPLRNDPDGVVRISGSRVTLDTVVAAFREGLTAEAIVEQYPSLRLADVYSIIGFLLSHFDKVEVYLKERQCHGDAVRAANEARSDPDGIRARLMKRCQSS